jgi:hypothetical protein
MITRLRLAGPAIAIAVLFAVPPRAAQAAPETTAKRAGGEHAAEPAPDAPAKEEAPAEIDPERMRLELRIRESMEHYNEGRALASEERYLEAAAEFERSFAAVESGTTLRLLALAYERGARPVKALEKAREYLALPPCDGPEKIDAPCSKQRDEATALARRTRALVGELTLDLPRDTKLREIQIDGRPVAPESFPLILAPGTYEIDMFGSERGQQRTRVVELDPGETEPLYVAPFSLPSDPRVGEVVRPGPDPEQLRLERERRARRTQGLKIGFWSGVGATAAAGSAAIVFGVLTRRRLQQYDTEQCDTGDDTQCDDPMHAQMAEPFPVGRRDDFLRYKELTNVMIGVTAGLGVATAIVGVFAFTRGKDQRRSQRWGVSPAGLVLRW